MDTIKLGNLQVKDSLLKEKLGIFSLNNSNNILNRIILNKRHTVFFKKYDASFLEIMHNIIHDGRPTLDDTISFLYFFQIGIRNISDVTEITKGDLKESSSESDMFSIQHKPKIKQLHNKSQKATIETISVTIMPKGVTKPQLIGIVEQKAGIFNCRKNRSEIELYNPLKPETHLIDGREVSKSQIDSNFKVIKNKTLKNEFKRMINNIYGKEYIP